MPSSFLGSSGRTLARSPNHRQQAGRRRLAVLCAIVALAIASGVIGSLVRPGERPPANQVAMGPFSYIPAQ